jgi:hypothetical protein
MMLSARELLLTVNPALLSEQLAMTKQFIENVQQGRAIKVVPAAKKAIDGNIVIDPCLDGYPDRFFNTGISLVQGWVDLDNDSPDPLYSHCIELGIRLYTGRLDYAFGRASKQCGGKVAPTHILMPLKGDIEKRKEVLPGAFYIDGEKHETEFRYLSKSSKPGSTQHSVGPGSTHFNGDQVDPVVWTSLNIARTAVLCEVDDVIRGVAAGQLIYTIARHWTVNRHHLAIPFTAILARAVSEGGAICADRSHPLHSHVIPLLPTVEHAERLLKAVCDVAGDDEFKDRNRELGGALDKMARGARLPGRRALAEHIGSGNDADIICSRLLLGSRLDIVQNMIERYVKDRTAEDIFYIDLKALKAGHPYHVSRAQAFNDNLGQVVTFGRKTIQAFTLFEMSDQRRMATGGMGMFPGKASGELLLVRNGFVLDDDYDGDTTGVLETVNIWRGLPHPAIWHSDESAGAQVIGDMLWVLEQLTRGSEEQISAVLDWVADIVQNPGAKRPVAIVSVADKGIGKSVFFNGILRALFGELYRAIQATVLEGRFPLDVFRGGLYVCFNEAGNLSDAAKLVLGNFIKDDWVGGEGKGDKASTIHNLARIAITTNKLDFNISARHLEAGSEERSLFYIRGHSPANMGVNEFVRYRNSIRPRFERIVATVRDNEDAMRHLMAFLKNRQTSMDKVLALVGSAHHDQDIRAANLSYVERAVKMMLENNQFIPGSIETLGKIVAKSDLVWGPELRLTPLSVRNLMDEFARVDSSFKVNANAVLRYFVDPLGALEPCGSCFVPTLGYGAVIAKFEEVTKVKVEPAYELSEADYADYDVTDAKNKLKGRRRR